MSITIILVCLQFIVIGHDPQHLRRKLKREDRNRETRSRTRRTTAAPAAPEDSGDSRPPPSSWCWSPSESAACDAASTCPASVAANFGEIQISSDNVLSLQSLLKWDNMPNDDTWHNVKAAFFRNDADGNPSLVIYSAGAPNHDVDLSEIPSPPKTDYPACTSSDQDITQCCNYDGYPSTPLPRDPGADAANYPGCWVVEVDESLTYTYVIPLNPTQD